MLLVIRFVCACSFFIVSDSVLSLHQGNFNKYTFLLWDRVRIHQWWVPVLRAICFHPTHRLDMNEIFLKRTPIKGNALIRFCLIYNLTRKLYHIHTKGL